MRYSSVPSDPSGIEGLINWLRGATVGTLITLRAVTTPSPSHRPRVSKWGTYYPKTYVTYHADCVKQFAVDKPKEPLAGPLAVVVETIMRRPKTTKLQYPNADSDNLAKAPLDAATKAGVWGDDKQIIPLATSRRFAAETEEPGVILHIGKLRA